LLTDVSLIRQSHLLSLGLDALDVSAQSHAGLVKRLRRDNQFPGARFELYLMASLTRGRIGWVYEPLKGLAGVNPDFEIDTAQRRFLLEVKAARVSATRRKQEAWYRTLMFGDAPAAPDILQAELEVDPAVTRLSEKERTVLAKAVRDVAKRLHHDGIGQKRSLSHRSRWVWPSRRRQDVSRSGQVDAA
jgi:hypothetical protein